MNIENIAVAVLFGVMAAFATASAKAEEPRLVGEPQVLNNRSLQLSLPPDLAQRVGRQVWLNETGGRRDAVTAWNAAENFASLGIGHFIWFPAGLRSPFQESFPGLLSYLRARGAQLPNWLDKDPIPPCPWNSRKAFKRDFQSPKMLELRSFLLSTVGLQAEFLSLRMQGALPKMLKTLRTQHERQHVRAQFYRVAAASPDLYPLIDYVNFKGEGTSPTEVSINTRTGAREGWGLKHVLLEMKGHSSLRSAVLGEFSEAAKTVLLRRIKNNPPSRRWQKGWLKRVATYRKPL